MKHHLSFLFPFDIPLSQIVQDMGIRAWIPRAGAVWRGSGWLWFVRSRSLGGMGGVLWCCRRFESFFSGVTWAYRGGLWWSSRKEGLVRRLADDGRQSSWDRSRLWGHWSDRELRDLWLGVVLMVFFVCWRHRRGGFAGVNGLGFKGWKGFRTQLLGWTIRGQVTLEVESFGFGSSDLSESHLQVLVVVGWSRCNSGFDELFKWFIRLHSGRGYDLGQVMVARFVVKECYLMVVF